MRSYPTREDARDQRTEVDAKRDDREGERHVILREYDYMLLRSVRLNFLFPIT